VFVPGEVVKVRSVQVAKQAPKPKYHLCICGHQGYYFFINSRSWQDSFQITKAELPALPKPQSHIACNTLLPITDEYMAENRAGSVGRLSKNVIVRLIEHIDACDVLTEEEKEIVIDGLTGAL